MGLGVRLLFLTPLALLVTAGGAAPAAAEQALRVGEIVAACRPADVGLSGRARRCRSRHQDPRDRRPRSRARAGARPDRRNPRLRVHRDRGSPARAGAPRRLSAAGVGDPGPHGQSHDLLRPTRLPEPGRQEPEPRVPGEGRRHAQPADRPRDHDRGDRPRQPRHRHALRRRQRVAAPLLVLAGDRRRGARRGRQAAGAGLRPRPHRDRPRAAERP